MFGKKISNTLGLITITATLLLSVGGRAAAGDIPWKEDVFEQISVDANIQDVLRTVIRRNGQGVIFRPGVEGEVTFEFINMPLQAAFNKLIEENGLDFSFDEATSMVTIFPFQEMKRSRLFITPRFMSLEEVKSATKRFHMDREADMIFDAESGSILLSGSPEAVRDVGGLLRPTLYEPRMADSYQFNLG
ncbi:MAG: hypothetical protein HN842_05685 [Gammaproteobacteria bacterium]|nr:hypothetical protein [Gammaproteobacteria bacterium]